VNVLLDTYTLLSLVSTPSDVDASALAAITDPNTNVWVTAASAWEIATKTRLGRLDGEALLSAWADIIADMTTTELPIESADAILAGWLPQRPGDRIAAFPRRSSPQKMSPLLRRRSDARTNVLPA
jgi:PIN domain nuclease of toxin-antitoxin system